MCYLKIQNSDIKYSMIWSIIICVFSIKLTVTLNVITDGLNILMPRYYFEHSNVECHIVILIVNLLTTNVI